MPFCFNFRNGTCTNDHCEFQHWDSGRIHEWYQEFEYVPNNKRPLDGGRGGGRGGGAAGRARGAHGYVPRASGGAEAIDLTALSEREFARDRERERDQRDRDRERDRNRDRDRDRDRDRRNSHDREEKAREQRLAFPALNVGNNLEEMLQRQADMNKQIEEMKMRMEKDDLAAATLVQFLKDRAITWELHLKELEGTCSKQSNQVFWERLRYLELARDSVTEAIIRLLSSQRTEEVKIRKQFEDMNENISKDRMMAKLSNHKHLIDVQAKYGPERQRADDELHALMEKARKNADIMCGRVNSLSDDLEDNDGIRQKNYSFRDYPNYDDVKEDDTKELPNCSLHLNPRGGIMFLKVVKKTPPDDLKTPPSPDYGTPVRGINLVEEPDMPQLELELSNSDCESYGQKEVEEGDEDAEANPDDDGKGSGETTGAHEAVVGDEKTAIADQQEPVAESTPVAQNDETAKGFTKSQTRKQRKAERKAREKSKKEKDAAEKSKGAIASAEGDEPPPLVAETPEEVRRREALGGVAVANAQREAAIALNPNAKTFDNVANTSASSAAVPLESVIGAGTPPGMPGLLDSEDEIEIEKDISLFVVKGVNGGPKKGDEVAAKKVAVRVVEVGAVEAYIPPLYVPKVAVPVVDVVGAQVAQVELIAQQAAIVNEGAVNGTQGLNLNAVDNVAGRQVSGSVAMVLADQEASVLTAIATETPKVTTSDGAVAGVGLAAQVVGDDSKAPELEPPAKPADVDDARDGGRQRETRRGNCRGNGRW